MSWIQDFPLKSGVWKMSQLWRKKRVKLFGFWPLSLSASLTNFQSHVRHISYSISRSKCICLSWTSWKFGIITTSWTGNWTRLPFPWLTTISFRMRRALSLLVLRVVFSNAKAMVWSEMSSTKHSSRALLAALVLVMVRSWHGWHVPRDK